MDEHVPSPDSSKTPEELFEELSKHVIGHPENGESWLQFADFLDEKWNHPDKTVHAYEKAQRLLPDQDLRLHLGGALVDAGRDDEGIIMLRDHIREKPTSYGYCILAHNLIKLDKYLEARQSAVAAIELEPRFEEAHYILGEAYRMDHSIDPAFRLEEAIRHYRDALKIDPEYQLAWQALGLSLLKNETGEKEGIDALRQAIRLNACDGWAMLFLANALWRNGSIEEAEQLYRRAIEVFPEYEECKQWYADFLQSQGRFDEESRLRMTAR